MLQVKADNHLLVADVHLLVVVAEGLVLQVKDDDHLKLVVLAADSLAVHVLLVADGLVVHETVDDLHLSVVVAVGLELHVHVKADDHLVLVVLAVDSQAVHVLLVADGLVVHVTAEDLHLHLWLCWSINSNNPLNAANGTRISFCIIQMFLYQRFHRFSFIFSLVCFHRFFLYSPLDSQ